MTSATYISQLEKNLQEEKKKREELSNEVEELKKVMNKLAKRLT
jgi:predicted RNase H-like nuclease (RuvC/YqgF family)